MEERIMDKVTIVFWSQSGNTESMANAVAEGVTAAGKEAVVVELLKLLAMNSTQKVLEMI